MKFRAWLEPSCLECGGLPPLFRLPSLAAAMRVFVGAGLAPPGIVPYFVAPASSPHLIWSAAACRRFSADPDFPILKEAKTEYAKLH